MTVRGSSIFAGCSSPLSGIYKTTNNGDNWFVTDTSLFSNVYCFANLGQYLFVAATGGIYRTSNEGVNWIHLSSELDAGFTTCMVVSGNKIFASGSFGSANGGLYVSNDFGINWVKLQNQIDCVSIYNNTIFSAFGSVVNVSTNNGLNWINWSEGNNGSTNSIFIFNEMAFLGGCTVCGPPSIPVLWRRPLSELTKIMKSVNNIPDKFSLLQNYPNPFNPSTNIRYDIPKNGFVKLVVFDILGREIETLVNEKQNAGTYEVTFNGSNLSSGIYFYTLSAGDYKETKKLVLLK